MSSSGQARGMLRKTLTITIFCLFLSACMVGPDYKEPPTNVANHWLQTSKSANVKETPVRDASWWQTFNDPTLTALIYQGYQNNLTVQIAGVRVLQTRAQLAQSVGQLYPQQQALFGNYTTQQIGGGELQKLLPSNFQSVQLGVTATWELDFWGKYRRAIQSKDANFLSSFAAYDNALVSLTADVATSYIAIRTYQEAIKVTEQNIKLQKESLAIAEAQHRAGQTSLQDVEQAKTELEGTIATLPGILTNLQHQKDLLAVLLGTTPDKVDALLIKNHGIPKAPPTVAVGIPCETMAQRPDVFQARMDAIAESAMIGSIKANLFPALSLGGTFSFSSTNIGNASLGSLFNASNQSYSFGPSFVWPILNYGQITNAVRTQDAVFEQSLLKYQNTVLQAQQEVQDNITRYIEAQKAEQSLREANRSATESTRIALVRYREGETDYTTVVDILRQQLQVQTNLVNATGEVSQSLVALYRALGGGWQIRDDRDIVAEQIKEEMAARTNWGTLLDLPNHAPPHSPMQQFQQFYLPVW